MASPSRRCADGSEKLNRLTELRNSAGLRRARLQPVATIGRGQWEMIMSRYLVVLTLTGSIFASFAAGAIAHAGAADSDPAASEPSAQVDIMTLKMLPGRSGEKNWVA